MGFVEPYHLAIDVGTSRVAAAISRLGADGRIHTLPVALGRRGDTVSTVVLVAEDGSLLFGDAAERRGVTHPERLVREFKRSIGDDVPFVVEGHVIAPERLYAETVASIVDTVADREGAAAEGVVLTHPVAWGAHRLGVVRDALHAVGLSDVELMTEPEAAARHYESGRPLDDGQSVAVYDLGGGTFDAVVLRREPGGSFRIVGRPAGIADLGGADFDDRVMRHAIGMAQVEPEHLTVERDDSRLALAQLRRECVEAKEALSYDSDATIPVLLASGSPSVRLTRAEFEGMIDDDVARTVDALDEALESAGLEAADLDCVLLIGGSSRIPLVTQRLSERFDRPLAIDADPKSSIALGAARTGLVRATDKALGVDDVSIASDVAVVPVDEAPSAVESRPEEGALLAPTSPADHATHLDRFSRPHLLALAGGTLFFVAAVLFSTSEAAGQLPQQSVASIDSTASGLTFDLPDYAPATIAPADGQAVAAPPAAIEPVADVQREQSQSAGSQPVRAKSTTRTASGTTVPTSTVSPSPSSSQPATSKNPTPVDDTPSSTGTGTTGTGTTGTGTTGTGTTGTGTTGTGTGSTEPSPSPSPQPSTPPSEQPTTPPSEEPTTPPSEEPTTPATEEPAPSQSPESTAG